MVSAALNLDDAAQLAVSPGLTVTLVTAEAIVVAWEVVKKMVMVKVSSLAPLLEAVPLAPQPPDTPAQEVIATLLRLSIELRTLVGSVCGVTPGGSPPATEVPDDLPVVLDPADPGDVGVADSLVVGATTEPGVVDAADVDGVPVVLLVEVHPPSTSAAATTAAAAFNLCRTANPLFPRLLFVHDASAGLACCRIRPGESESHGRECAGDADVRDRRLGRIGRSGRLRPVHDNGHRRREHGADADTHLGDRNRHRRISGERLF